MPMNAHLAALFEVAGREVTGELLKIARAIAGDAANNLTTAGPEIARLALRNIAEKLAPEDFERIGLAISWAMVCQHTATIAEIERRRRLAKIFEAETDETEET